MNLRNLWMNQDMVENLLSTDYADYKHDHWNVELIDFHLRTALG